MRELNTAELAAVSGGQEDVLQFLGGGGFDSDTPENITVEGHAPSYEPSFSDYASVGEAWLGRGISDSSDIVGTIAGAVANKKGGFSGAVKSGTIEKIVSHATDSIGQAITNNGCGRLGNPSRFSSLYPRFASVCDGHHRNEP